MANFLETTLQKLTGKTIEHQRAYRLNLLSRVFRDRGAGELASLAKNGISTEKWEKAEQKQHIFDTLYTISRILKGSQFQTTQKMKDVFNTGNELILFNECKTEKQKGIDSRSLTKPLKVLFETVSHQPQASIDAESKLFNSGKAVGVKIGGFFENDSKDRTLTTSLSTVPLRLSSADAQLTNNEMIWSEFIALSDELSASFRLIEEPKKGKLGLVINIDDTSLEIRMKGQRSLETNSIHWEDVQIANVGPGREQLSFADLAQMPDLDFSTFLSKNAIEKSVLSFITPEQMETLAHHFLGPIYSALDAIRMKGKGQSFQKVNKEQSQEKHHVKSSISVFRELLKPNNIKISDKNRKFLWLTGSEKSFSSIDDDTEIDVRSIWGSLTDMYPDTSRDIKVQPQKNSSNLPYQFSFGMKVEGFLNSLPVPNNKVRTHFEMMPLQVKSTAKEMIHEEIDYAELICSREQETMNFVCIEDAQTKNVSVTIAVMNGRLEIAMNGRRDETGEGFQWQSTSIKSRDSLVSEEEAKSFFANLDVAPFFTNLNNVQLHGDLLINAAQKATAFKHFVNPVNSALATLQNGTLG